MSLTIADDQLTQCERAFWAAADHSLSTDVEPVERCDGAFWAAMVALFPRVTTGDLDPLTTHSLTTAEELALGEWRSDGVQPETNAALRSAMREAADTWLAYNHPANQEPYEDWVLARDGSFGPLDAAAQPSPCVGDRLACTNPEHDHAHYPDAVSAPQAHLGDELACDDCGRPLFWCRRTVRYWHANPGAPSCFLVAARS